jgi:putative membrane protein
MTGIALALFVPHIGLRFGVTIEAMVFGLAGLIFEWLPIRMAIAPARVKHDHARALAHREFAARILSPHDGREGVLLFVSLNERYVEIVATSGVHKHAGDATWNAIVTAFTQMAAAGKVAEGAATSIEACAALLARHFPQK